MTRTEDERRRAQRRVARELHPDRGGDVRDYLAAMAELERRYRPAVTVVRTRRRTGLLNPLGTPLLKPLARRWRAWRHGRRQWIEL